MQGPLNGIWMNLRLNFSIHLNGTNHDFLLSVHYNVLISLKHRISLSVNSKKKKRTLFIILDISHELNIEISGSPKNVYIGASLSIVYWIGYCKEFLQTCKYHGTSNKAFIFQIFMLKI